MLMRKEGGGHSSPGVTDRAEGWEILSGGHLILRDGAPSLRGTGVPALASPQCVQVERGCGAAGTPPNHPDSQLFPPLQNPQKSLHSWCQACWVVLSECQLFFFFKSWNELKANASLVTPTFFILSFCTGGISLSPKPKLHRTQWRPPFS